MFLYLYLAEIGYRDVTQIRPEARAQLSAAMQSANCACFAPIIGQVRGYPPRRWGWGSSKLPCTSP